ncbi:DUF2939 domain-containing protein [Tardiphaga sp. 866_E4_N2_1]|uniref:DUF2939 domain-containing protein n=1 Tax=unclassified Tardiphaga TaxID=2631404 RepID=UPI003F25AB8E
MRRVTLIVLTLAIFTGAYVTSMAISTSRFVDAVRAGDGAAVLARTDLDRLKRSLTEQIIDAYLERVGKGAKRTTVLLANTYGASLADAMLTKLLSSENLKQLLKTGSVGDGAETFTLPPLTQIDAMDALRFIPRLFPVNIAEIGIRLSDAHSGDDYSAISFRFDGAGWKLATITLPKSRTRELAASLPVR